MWRSAVICAQDVPDHTVLARFRKNHADALADLLTASLVLAAELGMVSLGVVAFDGTKIAGNASRGVNRGEAHLRGLAEQYLDTVATTDAAEDGLFGEDDRGDGLPPQMRDRTGRADRIEQALAQITSRREQAEKAQRDADERIQECRREVAAGTRGTVRYPKGTDRVEMARLRWERIRANAADRYDQWVQARQRGEPRPVGGKAAVPPDQFYRVREAWAVYQAAIAARDAAKTAAGDSGQTGTTDDPSERLTANLTDPDSRLLKTRNGWVQGYNCQTATSDDGFIVSARATQDTNDVEQFIPTMNDVTATADMLASRTGRDDLTVGTMIGDAGYDSTTNLTADGPDRLIADSKRRTIDRRAATDPVTGDPPAHASPHEKMTHRLRTPDGHALYKRRAPMIEAPNAWLKDRRGLHRFARRGLAAAHAELRFASAVTNLLKIRTKAITATQLSTGQTGPGLGQHQPGTA